MNIGSSEIREMSNVTLNQGEYRMNGIVAFAQWSKMPKIASNIHLKETYFLPYGGGSMTDSGLPARPHMHYVSHTTTLCWPYHA